MIGHAGMFSYLWEKVQTELYLHVSSWSLLTLSMPDYPETSPCDLIVTSQQKADDEHRPPPGTLSSTIDPPIIHVIYMSQTQQSANGDFYAQNPNSCARQVTV